MLYIYRIGSSNHMSMKVVCICVYVCTDDVTLKHLYLTVQIKLCHFFHYFKYTCFQCGCCFKRKKYTGRTHYEKRDYCVKNNLNKKNN